MPKEISELTSGVQFSRSSNEGQLADSQTRTFRIIKSSIEEIVDIQQECNVRIGDEHPYNTNLYCVSFDARFEGDSRMVIAVTFNYQSTPSVQASGGGQDPRSQSPDVRPANWTIGSSLYEIPLWSHFGRRIGQQAWGQGGSLRNPANDMYEGVTGFDALVTISIVQYEANDPTKHAKHVGSINLEQITLGSLVMAPHTVMFRGVNCEPVVESWGPLLYRGWRCTYEFAYKANFTNIQLGTDDDPSVQTVELGWDIALPQTGFNVRAFVPGNGEDKDDIFGQPLKHGEEGEPFAGRIAIGDNGFPSLPDGTDSGDRVRAMVKVHSITGGTSQLPSAQPIALNDNGRPRNTNLMPLVYGYQVLRAIDLTNTLGLRLQ